ncbi:DUF5060 domain-containing protein [Tunicatimonas pelagia]|uniref:DUF5060 domain-containing protein n=1 Tax=Tunicatimonas pelagia TaxID=931531 RepID=UPI0026656A60|nr:DUF5060 domain-containing protein [Tunicatimonas pelagia]WKN42774.1 DUF5060 domain-containing protein [Tunicatimonas pelagia]
MSQTQYDTSTIFGFIYSIIFFTVSLAACSSSSEFHAITQNTDTLLAYEKLEISFDLSQTYDNPYDFKEIDVLAIFVDPDGKETQVPGFWYEGYAIDDQIQAIRKTELAQWMIRFTPTVAGTWSYQLQAKDMNGTKNSEAIEFIVAPAALTEKGFIRMHPINKQYYHYENSGGTFFAAGLNVDVNAFLRLAAADSANRNWGTGSNYKPPWTGLPGTGLTDSNLYTGYNFQKNMINSLGEHGGNAARFIADIYYHPLEAKADGEAYGSIPFGDMGFALGKYHPAMCFLLDQLYENAEQHDIGIIHTVWDAITDQPYSAGTVYAEEKNESLIKQRLRYTLARWGYSPSYWMTEYFNEYDRPYDDYWQDISTWLRTVDPYQHPITFTSDGHGGETGPDAYILHTYDGSCWTINAPTDISVPALMGEFGGNARIGTKDPATYDPEGNWVRQTQWNALVSGWTGALTWWTHPIYGERGCDAYADIYPALSKFLKNENLTDNAPWQELSHEGNTEGLEHVRLLTNQTQQRTFLWAVRTPPHETTDREALSGREITVTLPEGTYTIEWWDSQKGEILDTYKEAVTQSGLKIDIPNSITRDIGAKIIKDE